MILSLCSLSPSYVLSIFHFLYLYTLSFPFVFFSLPYVFLHKVVFLNITFITYQKKNIFVVRILPKEVDEEMKATL